LLDRPLKKILQRAEEAQRAREEQKQKEREEFEKLKGSQLARDIGLPDLDLPPSRWPRSGVP
jgi:hypothetical protein